MIGFCEDCGAKNALTKEAVLDGIVRFRCSACGYSNGYALSGNSEIPRQLPEILRHCPEILAAFLVQEGNPPVILRLPDGLKSSDTALLGQHLAKSLAAILTLFPDVREQRVCIADKHLTVLRSAKTEVLCLISAVPELPARIISPIQRLVGGDNG